MFVSLLQAVAAATGTKRAAYLTNSVSNSTYRAFLPFRIEVYKEKYNY
jgi:hypothetical protein